MSFTGIMFNLTASVSDYKRDKQIPLPAGVTECRNISYGSHGKSSLLDVYYPEGTKEPLPTIVSIHGGGYVYGSKEIYRRYGMDLARRGFAFVNFNYRLAPRWRFPAPLEDTAAVMGWIRTHAEQYHLDPSRIILVGDSAGAQLASQYAAMNTNPEYAAQFSFDLPEANIIAVGLNCGMYDLYANAGYPRTGIHRDYLGREISPSDPRLQVLRSITGKYPPAYIMTACNDFLRDNAEPMGQLLTERGVKNTVKCYGTPEQKEIAHVFHVNIRLPEAQLCNDEECAFFRSVLEAQNTPAV